MKTVLITGANRGLGLGFVKACLDKDWHVYATCRQPNKATDLIDLKNTYAQLHIECLDVCDDNSILALALKLKEKPIDFLINNAGISGAEGVTVGNIQKNNFMHVLEVNCYGTLKVSEALLPNVKKSDEKLIMVISSRMGSISDNDRGRSYAYRTSKAAVNCVMRSFAIDVKEDGVKVLLMHPGWVQTDMGGNEATVTVEKSVNAMLKEMLLHKDSAHADVLRRFDGDVINW